MKFYEAMTEIKGTNKMFVPIMDSTWAHIYKFSEDGKDLVRAALWYAMVDRYWLPVYFNTSEWFNRNVCKEDYQIINSIEDLYKLYLSRNGDYKEALARLKLASRYKVVTKEQEQKILEVINDYQQ